MFEHKGDALSMILNDGVSLNAIHAHTHTHIFPVDTKPLLRAHWSEPNHAQTQRSARWTNCNKKRETERKSENVQVREDKLHMIQQHIQYIYECAHHRSQLIINRDIVPIIPAVISDCGCHNSRHTTSNMPTDTQCYRYE